MEPVIRSSLHRRLLPLVIIVIILIGAAPLQPALAAAPRPLALGFEGDARRLPDHILGGSLEALIEHVLDDPAKVAALVKTAPATVRFPGGSQSNYYNWRTGFLSFDAQANRLASTVNNPDSGYIFRSPKTFPPLIAVETSAVRRWRNCQL
jgi:hypothetical protein